MMIIFQQAGTWGVMTFRMRTKPTGGANAGSARWQAPILWLLGMGIHPRLLDPPQGKLLGQGKGFREAVPLPALREPGWETERVLPDRPALPQRCDFRVCIQGMPLLPSPCRQLPSHRQPALGLPGTVLL